MIVILEGPDNAGKSTLGEKLSKDLGIELIHPGGPPKTTLDVISRCEEQAVAFSMSTIVDIIFDRVTCISDAVYRNRSNLEGVYRSFQSHIRSSKNVIIVYCRPSDARVKNFDDHIQKDHEDAAVVQHAIDNVDRIVNDYDALMYALMADKHFNVTRYNFEEDSSDLEYTNLLFALRLKKDFK